MLSIDEGHGNKINTVVNMNLKKKRKKTKRENNFFLKDRNKGNLIHFSKSFCCNDIAVASVRPINEKSKRCIKRKITI